MFVGGGGGVLDIEVAQNDFKHIEVNILDNFDHFEIGKLW